MCTMTFEKAQAELQAEQQRIPQTVQFEVQDILVENLPQITSNIEKIKAWCESRVEVDRNMVLVTDSDFEQAKNRHAEINKTIKYIKERRTSIKKQYMQPYDVFDKKVNETIAVLEEANENLWSQVTSAEEKRRTDKLNKLKTYWEETLKPDVTSYRKFDSIFNPKWLNKGTKFTVAFGEMDKHYEQIENDLTAIQSLNSEFETPLLEYYKDGHNLGEVIAYNNRLQSQKLARETAKAETQANAQNADEQGGQAQQTAQIDENEEVFPVVFKVVATRAKINALAQYLKDNEMSYEQAEWVAKK